MQLSIFSMESAINENTEFLDLAKKHNVNYILIDDTYKINMSRTDEGWIQDSGEFHGKITYGENSKFIIKIE